MKNFTKILTFALSCCLLLSLVNAQPAQNKIETRQIRTNFNYELSSDQKNPLVTQESANIYSYDNSQSDVAITSERSEDNVTIEGTVTVKDTVYSFTASGTVYDVTANGKAAEVVSTWGYINGTEDNINIAYSSIPSENKVLGSVVLGYIQGSENYAKTMIFGNEYNEAMTVAQEYAKLNNAS